MGNINLIKYMLSDHNEVSDSADISSPEVTLESSPKSTDTENKDANDIPTSSKEDSDDGKDKKVEFRSIILRKTSQREVKTDSSHSDRDVVMRQESPGKQHDPNKRKTIASGTDLSIFGERKISKRSSLSETKNWEDGKDEKSATSTGEFTAVFSRIHHQPSLKLIKLQKEGENLEDERKKEKKEVQKILLSPKHERSSSSTVTKDSGVKVKAESPEAQEKSLDKSINNKNSGTPTVSSAAVKSISAQPKTVTLIIAKTPTPVAAATAPSSSEDKENTNYKRPSPIVKNRGRSQTLTEQPTISKDINDRQHRNEASPKSVRKTGLSTTEGGSNSASTVSKTNSPQRSASVLIKSGSGSHLQPKRLTIKDSNSGSTPSWIKVAKEKQNADADEERKVDKGKKNDEVSILCSLR